MIGILQSNPDTVQSIIFSSRRHRPAKGLLLLLLWWCVSGLAPLFLLTGQARANPSGHPPPPPNSLCPQPFTRNCVLVKGCIIQPVGHTAHVS